MPTVFTNPSNRSKKGKGLRKKAYSKSNEHNFFKKRMGGLQILAKRRQKDSPKNQ